MKIYLGTVKLIFLACFLCLGQGLSAQDRTLGAGEMPYDQYMNFKASESMFYYSDIGYETGNQAVLIAANANAGGSMLYHTLDTPVYLVGMDDSIYIAKSTGELETALSGEPVTVTTEYEVQINSPSNAANSNLSLFVLQLEQDESGGRFMYVGGIGIAVIQDVDPNTFQGIQIPNGQIFSIETITTVSSDCNGSGNHALVIKW